MQQRARQSRGRSSALAFALICAIAAVFGSKLASAADPLESRVKAAFLFNFARFVSWPSTRFAEENSPLTLCVTKSGEFLEILQQTIIDKHIGEHPLELRHIAHPSEAASCHLVYVLADSKKDIDSWLNQLTRHGVLTVYDRDAPIASGVVRFYLEDRHVRFEINVGAAERERLLISSKLLAVAQLVNQ